MEQLSTKTKYVYTLHYIYKVVEELTGMLDVWHHSSEEQIYDVEQLFLRWVKQNAYLHDREIAVMGVLEEQFTVTRTYYAQNVPLELHDIGEYLYSTRIKPKGGADGTDRS